MFALNTETLLLFLIILNLSGCDTPGNGSLVSCASSMTGTFEGTRDGLVSANLDVNGKLSFTFVGDNAFQIEGRNGVPDNRALVSDDGEISHLRLSGVFDFDRCVAEGEWSRVTESGTFTIALMD